MGSQRGQLRYTSVPCILCMKSTRLRKKRTYLVIDLGISGGAAISHAILRRMGKKVARTRRHEVAVGIDGGTNGHKEKGGNKEEGGRSANSEAKRVG